MSYADLRWSAVLLSDQNGLVIGITMSTSFSADMTRTYGLIMNNLYDDDLDASALLSPDLKGIEYNLLKEYRIRKTDAVDHFDDLVITSLRKGRVAMKMIDVNHITFYADESDKNILEAFHDDVRTAIFTMDDGAKTVSIAYSVQPFWIFLQ
jgi:hypothetical protein